MSTLKSAMATTVVAASFGFAASTASALNIVFINDGHVAPYHVAWLGGFEDAIEAYDKEFGDVTGRWLSAKAAWKK